MSARIAALDRGRLEDAVGVLAARIDRPDPEHGKPTSVLIVVEWEDGFYHLQELGGNEGMSPNTMAAVSCVLSHLAASACLAEAE